MPYECMKSHVSVRKILNTLWTLDYLKKEQFSSVQKVGLHSPTKYLEYQVDNTSQGTMCRYLQVSEMTRLHVSQETIRFQMSAEETQVRPTK